MYPVYLSTSNTYQAMILHPIHSRPIQCLTNITAPSVLHSIQLPTTVFTAGGSGGSAASAVMPPQPVVTEGSGLTEEEEAEVKTHYVTCGVI